MLILSWELASFWPEKSTGVGKDLAVGLSSGWRLESRCVFSLERCLDNASRSGPAGHSSRPLYRGAVPREYSLYSPRKLYSLSLLPPPSPGPF